MFLSLSCILFSPLKDANSRKQEAEWKEKAIKELEEWYARQDEQLQKTKANNRSVRWASRRLSPVHLPAHSLGSWLCLPSYERLLPIWKKLLETEAASLLGLMSIIQPGLSVALKLGIVSSAIMVGSGEVALQNSEMKGQLQSLITLETITD